MIRKVFLFIFIFLCFGTSCFAWTWDDFITFCSNAKNTSVNSNVINACNTIVNNSENIKNVFSNNNINIDDYYNFVCFRSDGNSYYQLFLLNRNVTMQYNASVSGRTYHFRIQGLNPSPSIRLDNLSFINNTTSVKYGNYNLFGLFSGNTQFFTADDYFSNKFNYIQINNTDFIGKTFPYYFADGRIGSYYYNSNYKWFISNDNFSIELLVDGFYTLDDGYLWSLSIDESILSNLVDGEEYFLYYGDIDHKIYSSENFIVYFKDISGYVPIIRESGEITNIDLTNITNGLNDINNNIDNLPSNIGNVFYNSGDSGEKGIFQKVYEDLFTIKQDELNVMLSDFISDNQLTSGEVEIAMLGFNKLNNSGDFIISWNSINNDFLRISGDSINFSAFVRDNTTLSQVMFYVRNILGVSLLLLLLGNYFKTLLVTLGVSTEIFESSKQESQPVESVVVTTDKKGRVTTTRTLKTSSGVTYRWKK